MTDVHETLQGLVNAVQVLLLVYMILSPSTPQITQEQQHYIHSNPTSGVWKDKCMQANLTPTLGGREVERLFSILSSRENISKLIDAKRPWQNTI